jgi:dTDP-4-amino-4,6-dideoxygalactose transaminase
MQIPIAKPLIGEEEKQAVLEVLESGELAQGKYVAAFEKNFADYHGTAYGVAAMNGTAALIAALMAHNIGPGDEVIVPAFTFFATASCLLAVGAVPVFGDIEPETFCLTPESAEALITEKTKAIMPVHLYGHPADMNRFQELCDRHGLILLEDAAQAHGAQIDGRYVGNWGTASFSFYATKNIMTIEGGMVLTNDPRIDERLRLIRNHGMGEQYKHILQGLNLRMTNLTAAIGLVQLKRLAEWTAKRIENAAYLNQHLTYFIPPVVKPGYTHVYHQYTVRVPDAARRDEIVDWLNQQGIGARVYYKTPLHQQPIFQEMERYQHVELPVTEDIANSVLSLPVHPALSREDLERIVEVVNSLERVY